MRYKIYANLGNGWKLFHKTKKHEEVKDFIREVYELDERCEVIIKYRSNDCDYVLCSFVNTLSTLDDLNMKLERKLK